MIRHNPSIYSSRTDEKGCTREPGLEKKSVYLRGQAASFYQAYNCFMKKHLSKMHLLVSLLVVLMLSACAGAAEKTPSSPEPTPGVSYRNPILEEDFPDPFVLEADGRYYAYATNATGRRIQVSVSDDLVTWGKPSNAMPRVVKWASSQNGLTWAPEVIEIGSTYVMYYTTRDVKSNKQCIGVATSEKPEGPFTDTTTGPLVCQAEEGGTIDASPFRDGDNLYLYYKNDGNCCGLPTRIYAQHMAADGLSLVGEPEVLITNDQGWEAHVIEAPTMWKHDGKYYLFFSANDYGNEKYAVGYALCESASGPCKDADENPILKSDIGLKPPVIGPGHQTLIETRGQTWMFYHAWNSNTLGQRGGRRFLWLDRVDWVDGKPVVRGPSTTAQYNPKED
jgi:beta-xylosidase